MSTATDLTPAQEAALNHARHLAESGAPVFVATPAEDATGKWDPTGGHNGCGFWLPPGWQQAEADPSAVDDWRPGDALCLLSGVLVDVVDVDPRNGGDAASLDGTMPVTYGTQSTPSGGTHDLIATLGVRKGKPLPGIDVQAGNPDGKGRGFVFLAPTRRKSKTTGEIVAYEWVRPPAVGMLLIEDDDSGAALREFMVARVAPVYDGPAYDGPAYAALTPEQQAQADSQVAGLIEGWRSRFQEAQDWPDGERDDRGRGWEEMCKDFAWSLAMLVACPWTRLDEDDAAFTYDNVVPDVIATDSVCEGKWYDGIVGKAAGLPVAPPPWETPFTPIQTEDGTGESAEDGTGPPRVSQTVRMVQYVRDHFHLFPAGDDGRVFAQHKQRGGRAELVTGPFVLRTAARTLRLQSASLSAAAAEAAKQIAWEAEDRPERRLAMRVHYQPGMIVLDLSQKDNGRCVVVTPAGWSVQDSPPPDVVFHASGRPLPEPVRGGDVEELRGLLRWAEDDPRWPLIKGWLPAALLAGRPRPLLGFFGEKGSAKTTTGWFAASVLDPKPTDPMTLGSGFGKQRQDDETKALKSYLPSWDNVSSLSGEGADFLSRLVTGDNIERRRLYSDSDVVTLTYRRTGVITGVTVPRGLKTDTQDRLIMIPMHAPKAGARVTEEALLADWARVHPRVLGGVLDLAVRMLSRMGDAPNTAGKRMADYASALWAVDPALYDAYVHNHDNAEADMAAEDPFIQVIYAWLSARDGEAEGESEALRRDAEGFRDLDQWWPRNGKAFMDEVTRTTGLLRAIGITVTERRSNGKRLKKFSLSDGEREV